VTRVCRVELRGVAGQRGWRVVCARSFEQLLRACEVGTLHTLALVWGRPRATDRFTGTRCARGCVRLRAAGQQGQHRYTESTCLHSRPQPMDGITLRNTHIHIHTQPHTRMCSTAVHLRTHGSSSATVWCLLQHSLWLLEAKHA
jgi:hypothetical protein